MNSLKSNILACPSVLTGMSHEVRTHMNAIVAYSYLLKENSGEDSKREEFSNHVFNSCEQLIGLFDAFLDSILLGIEHSKNDSRICIPNNIINEVLPELNELITKTGNRDIELITDITDDMKTEAYIDKAKVIRIIKCLFLNSLKNTSAGYIKIGSKVIDGRIRFSFTDSGIGFRKSKEFLITQNMNEALYQNRDTFSAINLTLAKNLIYTMDGDINIENNGISGTMISFTIPLKTISNTNKNTVTGIKTIITY